MKSVATKLAVVWEKAEANAEQKSQASEMGETNEEAGTLTMDVSGGDQFVVSRRQRRGRQ